MPHAPAGCEHVVFARLLLLVGLPLVGLQYATPDNIHEVVQVRACGREGLCSAGGNCHYGKCYAVCRVLVVVCRMPLLGAHTWPPVRTAALFLLVGLRYTTPDYIHEVVQVRVGGLLYGNRVNDDDDDNEDRDGDANDGVGGRKGGSLWLSTHIPTPLPPRS